MRARKDTLGSYARSYGGIETANNRFVIAVTPAQRALVETLAADAGVTLIDRRSTPKTEYDAGCTSRLRLDDPRGLHDLEPVGRRHNCSVGFTARNSANARYTYTAGHCSSGATLWGTGLPVDRDAELGPQLGPRRRGDHPRHQPVVQVRLRRRDLQRVLPDRSVAVKLVAPTLSLIWSGDLVCLAANFTSPNGPNFCGVVGTNSDSSVRGMVRVDGLDACRGDTGGGWYWLTPSGRRTPTASTAAATSAATAPSGGSQSWFSALPTVKSTYTPSLNVETR